MYRSASVFASAVLIAFAMISTLSAPAQAQQAAAFTNPFDDQSDISNWSNYGYPFSWDVDSSPIGGYNSQASLNFNNGSDFNADYPYGDIYNYSSPIDLTGMNSPVLSFWCYYETANNSTYPDHRLLWTYDQNYNAFYGYELSGDQSTPWGYNPLECPAMSQWHQHTIALQQDIVSAGTLITEFYFTSDSYYNSSGLDGWFIDNLQILVPDVTPPAAITDLAVSNATLDTIDVAWSSPADDDVSGVTASFDLRYSTTAITAANFSSATAVAGEPAPDVAGTGHTMTVTGLSNGTTYYFAIKATDIAGNVGTISNLPSVATLTPPPPPPPTGGSGTTAVTSDEIDTILPCSAGATASSSGLLVLAGLIALAAAVRMLKK